MKNEIDLEKDFADAKAVCASKMLKNNRSFIEFCNARTQAFVKNYMKEPTWEWNFNRDDIESAKELTFDAWYKKIDIRDYFLDAGLLKKLLAGLSADEIKVLLCSEMWVFYDAFTKDVQKDWAEEVKDEEEKYEESPKENKTDKGTKNPDPAKAFKDALDAACELLDGKAAQKNTEESVEHCKNDEIGAKKSKKDSVGDKNEEDSNFDEDGDFLCADLKDLLKSLHGNINSLTEELKGILSEEEDDDGEEDEEKETPKKKGKEKKDED